VNGITIVTPTIPERAALFAELEQAVACQVENPDAWIVHHDTEHAGTIAALEILMAQVETEWFVPLADDDLIDPTFVMLLAKAVHDGVDVVWPLCRVEGTCPWWEGISHFDPDLLRDDNYIPAPPPSAPACSVTWAGIGTRTASPMRTGTCGSASSMRGHGSSVWLRSVGRTGSDRGPAAPTGRSRGGAR